MSAATSAEVGRQTCVAWPDHHRLVIHAPEGPRLFWQQQSDNVQLANGLDWAALLDQNKRDQKDQHVQESPLKLPQRNKQLDK